METHPTRIIETAQGNIVMASPDLLRSTALSNSIYTYVLTDEELKELNRLQDNNARNEFIELKSLKRGMTTFQLTVLAYVVSAPFHLNDYSVEPVLDLKSFLSSVDMATIMKMKEAMGELGVVDPLSV